MEEEHASRQSDAGLSGESQLGSPRQEVGSNGGDLASPGDPEGVRMGLPEARWGEGQVNLAAVGPMDLRLYRLEQIVDPAEAMQLPVTEVRGAGERKEWGGGVAVASVVSLAQSLCSCILSLPSSRVTCVPRITPTNVTPLALHRPPLPLSHPAHPFHPPPQRLGRSIRGWTILALTVELFPRTGFGPAHRKGRGLVPRSVTPSRDFVRALVLAGRHTRHIDQMWAGQRPQVG